MVTKTRRWIGKAAAVALASAIAVPFVAGMLPIRAGAAVEYSDNLVRYGTSEEYENDFLTFTESTKPTSPIDLPVNNNKLEVYKADASRGAQFVLDEESGQTYIRLYKTTEGTTGQDSYVWLQPGALPAGTYTISATIFATRPHTAGDSFRMEYNAKMDNGGAKVENSEQYKALPDSETVTVDGQKAKVMSYTKTLDAATGYPATHFVFWTKANAEADCEGRIYDVTYKNSEGEIVYYNDFSSVFDTQATAAVSAGFDNQDFGGIYYDGNTVAPQIVRTTSYDGTKDHYLRFYDSDTDEESPKKDTSNSIAIFQPVRYQAPGNYKYVIDFKYRGQQNEMYLSFEVLGGADGSIRKAFREWNSVTSGANGKDKFGEVEKKNGMWHVELNYELDVTAHFNPLLIHFWHGNNEYRELWVYDVRLIDCNDEEETEIYHNDFSEAFTRDKVMSVGNRYDHNDGINSTVEKLDDGNVFIRMSGNYATLNTGLWYKEEGTQNMKQGLPVVADYTVEFDIGRSEDANGELEFFFASVDPTFNTASKILTVVADEDQFNALYDPSDEIEGWGHYKGTLKVNNLMLPNLLSMFCIYTGAGSVTIDNLSVRAKLGSVVIEETPSTEGLKFRDLVLGGDFDYLAEGTKFVGEPTNDTYFWGSTSSDTAGEIVDLDGNKVLKLQNDGDTSKKWASAFVFLDPDELSEQNIYTLSYKFKYVEKEAFDPGIGLQVTFIGENGKEHYVQYLNWLDAISETSGENPSEWPFEVEYLDDDWISIEMTFCLNNTFMRDVNQSISIRFLNFNDGSTEPTLYIDDVKFGVWEEPTAEVPGDDEPEGPQGGTTESGGKKKGCGSVIGIGAGAILTVSLAAAFVLGKRENNE